jgi:hypothetical protein
VRWKKEKEAFEVSIPVGPVDIIGMGKAKIGEVTINEDGTIEGLLFEEPGQSLMHILRPDPTALAFWVKLHPTL